MIKIREGREEKSQNDISALLVPLNDLAPQERS
jgi:hypothetical protein